MLGDTSSPSEAMSNHVKTIQHRIATLAEYQMFSRRIRDGMLNRLVLGWLKAGVLHTPCESCSRRNRMH